MQLTTRLLKYTLFHIFYMFNSFLSGYVERRVYLSAGMLEDGHHRACILTLYTSSRNNMFLQRLFNLRVLDLPYIFLFLSVSPMFFLGVSSISQVKNKKIQALARIDVFLAQKNRCRV